MRDRVDLILYLEFSGVEKLGVIDGALCLFGYFCHCRDSLDRIFAHCRFAREHDGARAVIDGVGNVGYLRTRRARVVDHGFKHFGRRYDALAAKTAGRYHHFLNGGELLEGYFYAHVAARDHNAVARVDDLDDVIDAGAVFYFCDYVYLVSAVLVQEAAHVLDVLFVRNK